MIVVSTMLGAVNLEMRADLAGEAETFADACCIITAIYKRLRDEGKGESFKRTMISAANDGTLFGDKKPESALKKIINRALKEDKGNDD